MQIKAIESNQNFNGNFIIEGKISRKNIKLVQDFISQNTSIKKEPFDIYIKESDKKNIHMALNKEFFHCYGIKRDAVSKSSLAVAYNRLAKDAHAKLQKCSAIDQVLCTLGVKKII